MRYLHFVIGAAFALGILSCASDGFTTRERQIIQQQDSLLYVTVCPLDSAILRTPCTDFGASELRSPLLQSLKDKMVYTLRDPSQDGVGIAAPQVGISRRLIWVQRLDKADEPFECYVNVRIDSLAGAQTYGPEGCLSLPGLRGLVPRREVVYLSYLEPGATDPARRVSERVEGYTAIIFQHECDHLDGVLYSDRADTVYVNTAWAAERAAFNYSRPEWW